MADVWDLVRRWFKQREQILWFSRRQLFYTDWLSDRPPASQSRTTKTLTLLDAAVGTTHLTCSTEHEFLTVLWMNI